MENTNQDKGKKKLLIIGGLALVVLIIVVAVLANNKKEQPADPAEVPGQVVEVTETDNPLAVPPISQDLPEEVREILSEAVIEAPGASLITKDDKVVNDVGVEVKNDARPMTAEAPRLTPPINEKDLAPSAIKLKATSAGFSPSEFTVKSGAPVTISLTSEGVDSRLVFTDPNLKALEIPVPMGYTMAKTFNAPAPGTYEFYQDIPGRSEETGKMIVQ